MDATERPLRIPPEFSIYAEKHHIFEVFQQILTALIIKKPDDPLPFISDYLKRITEDVLKPRILILGPPNSGKTTISQMLSEKFDCCHVKEEDIFTHEVLNRFEVLSPKQIHVPDWVELVKQTLESLEEQNVGWIMDGIVPSRQHALFLCATGYLPNHTVVLKAPNNILLSRGASLFAIPEVVQIEASSNISQNKIKLEEPKLIYEEPLELRMNNYCLKSEALISVYSHTAKRVNVDQPIEDVFSRVLDIVCQPKRLDAVPQTPRVIFFGPVGSGKGTLARMFHEKYKINIISYEKAKMHEISKETKLGEIFKLSSETCMPDAKNSRFLSEPSEAMFDLVRNKLDNLEQHSRGWILYGYPTNRKEAEFLHAANYEPSRVFFLEVSNEKIIERLTLQGMDPLTGKIYHMTKKPPENEKIKNRLEVHPHNSLENVCFKITTYRENEPFLRDFYKDVSFSVAAEMDLEKVFEIMEGIIVNPLPLKINN